MSTVDSQYLLGAVYQAASTVGNTSVPYVATGWDHMTNTYSKFTIATVFSAILHEVKHYIKNYYVR